MWITGILEIMWRKSQAPNTFSCVCVISSPGAAAPAAALSLGCPGNSPHEPPPAIYAKNMKSSLPQ